MTDGTRNLLRVRDGVWQLGLIERALLFGGFAWIVISTVRLGLGHDVSLNLLGVLAIPISLGLRARKDLWRLIALGMAFLVTALAVMSVLLAIGAASGPNFRTMTTAEAVAYVALTTLGCWASWVLTRPAVLRAFGNAIPQE